MNINDKKRWKLCIKLLYSRIYRWRNYSIPLEQKMALKKGCFVQDKEMSHVKVFIPNDDRDEKKREEILDSLTRHLSSSLTSL